MTLLEYQLQREVAEMTTTKMNVLLDDFKKNKCFEFKGVFLAMFI